MGPRPSTTSAERFDGVRPTTLRVPAEVLAAALEHARPAGAGRARGVDPARPPRPRRPAAHRHDDRGRPRRHGHRALGARRPRRPLRARRPGGLPHQRRHERRAGPGRPGSGPSPWPARPSARTPAAFAGYPHPTILAACALLGVDEVYAVGGAQAVAAFAYGFEDAEGANATRCEPVSLVTGPGQHLRRRRQAAAQGPHRHRRRGRPHRDRRPRRRHRRRRARRRRPRSARPSTTRWPRRCSSPTAPELAERVAAALVRRVAATKHTERVGTALAGTPVGASCSSTTSTPASTVVNAYAAEHLEIQTRDAAAVAARVRNAGAVFVGPYSPVSLGDYAAGSNHVLPTGGCAVPQQRPVGAVVPARHPRRHLRRGRACARSGGHVVTLAQAEDLPAHGEAVHAPASATAPRDRGRAPTRTCCAPTCAAARPTARRSSTCPCG